MLALNDLIQAFDNNLLFAWELLHAEILLDTYPVDTDHLKNLIAIYSKGLQKFNSFHLPNENYFKLKINQLMTQRKVLNCLHTDQNLQRSHKKMEETQPNKSLINKPLPRPERKFDISMQLKKQEFDLRITYDIEESKKNKIGEMIKEEKVKLEKVKDLVKSCLEKEEDKLKRKISKRQARAQANSKLRYSLKLEDSCISTFGDGGQDWRDNEVVLTDLSFSNDCDGQI